MKLKIQQSFLKQNTKKPSSGDKESQQKIQPSVSLNKPKVEVDQKALDLEVKKEEASGSGESIFNSEGVFFSILLAILLSALYVLFTNSVNLEKKEKRSVPLPVVPYVGVVSNENECGVTMATLHGVDPLKARARCQAMIPLIMEQGAEVQWGKKGMTRRACGEAYSLNYCVQRKDGWYPKPVAMAILASTPVPVPVYYSLDAVTFVMPNGQAVVRGMNEFDVRNVGDLEKLRKAKWRRWDGINRYTKSSKSGREINLTLQDKCKIGYLDAYRISQCDDNLNQMTQVLKSNSKAGESVTLASKRTL